MPSPAKYQKFRHTHLINLTLLPILTLECPAASYHGAKSKYLLTFNVAVLFGGWIKLHDVTGAVEAIFRKSLLRGFLIVVVALENARGSDAQLARPIAGVLIIRIDKSIKNVSVP